MNMPGVSSLRGNKHSKRHSVTAGLDWVLLLCGCENRTGIPRNLCVTSSVRAESTL